LPGLSTHINFARLVLERTAVSLDRVHYILGCVAPDCINLRDGQVFAQSHFLSANKVPDLNTFLHTANLTINIITSPNDSFLYGYFSHLWLDRYIQEHGHTLQVVNNLEMSETEKSVAFKINIRRYDLGYIKELISKDTIGFDPDISLFHFLSGDLILKRLSDVLDFADISNDNSPTIISEEHYINFLIDAADIFLTQASLWGQANIT